MVTMTIPSRRPNLPAVLVAFAAALASACGPSEPRTDAERLAKGREIIEKMSARLGAAQTLSVTTKEVRDQLSLGGKPQTVTLNRETVVRRPDRVYFRTSGDLHNEGWYDGVGFTFAMHDQKVFAQARMPETLDKTLDAMHERYGVATPIADFIYSAPAKALLSDSTTGGWVARETVDGQTADHLSFKDTGVSWEIWIAASGDPLPIKGHAEFPESNHLKKVDLAYSNWNLAPTIADGQFDAKVPADFEGIAILQRARVLRNIPEDTAAPAASPASDEKPGAAKK